MTPRPTRSIEPLPPPPGRFDEVLREARARRYHRAVAVAGVAGVFLAGIMGGLALGGVGRIQATVANVASNLGVKPSPAPTESSTTATRVPSTGNPSSHRRHPGKHSGTAVVPAEPLAMVRGKAVDEGGEPVAGLYVYAGHFQSGDLVPSALPLARTGSSGRFAIPCEDAVLLTPWPLNEPLREQTSGRFAATTITAPVCSRSTEPQVTTMLAGAAVEGQVRTDLGCASQDFRAALWLDGERTTAVQLRHLREGDAFRLGGLPVGQHVLRVHGKEYPVVVSSAAATVVRNVTVACPPVPSPTDLPSLTPSPAPTPSETTSPSPSGTVTPTETPSPSSTGQRH